MRHPFPGTLIIQAASIRASVIQSNSTIVPAIQRSSSQVVIIQMATISLRTILVGNLVACTSCPTTKMHNKDKLILQALKNENCVFQIWHVHMFWLTNFNWSLSSIRSLAVWRLYQLMQNFSLCYHSCWKTSARFHSLNFSTIFWQQL